MDKSTDELMNTLHSKPDADHYLKENDSELLHMTLTELLISYLISKNLEKADVIRDSGLDRTYSYQIFNGLHKPSRDKLLCLAFGLHLTVPETQQLLKTAQMAPLYPRIKRDVLILEALFQGKDIGCCNRNLEKHEETVLQ